ncbi:unnamed protein product [Lactuca saligna]|uniref:Uncharacterized protein n=1 Tax=Lactuca saligna TaxID=75948 RepID=A0AA36EJR6_LACSI|nr:unnamed protein product [Lactuca saligna]
MVATGRLLKKWHGHYRPVTCLVFSNDQSLLISGSEDGTVRVWSLLMIFDEEGQQRAGHLYEYSFTGHALPITDIVSGFGGSNAIILSASLDRTCKVWSLTRGTLLRNIVFPSIIDAVALDPGEHVFLCWWERWENIHCRTQCSSHIQQQQQQQKQQQQQQLWFAYHWHMQTLLQYSNCQHLPRKATICMTRPLLLVTASVDKMVLKKTISVDGDLKMGGSVVWVERSSIDVQLGVTQLSIDELKWPSTDRSQRLPRGAPMRTPPVFEQPRFMKHSSNSTSTEVDIKSKPTKIKEPNLAGNRGSKGSSSKGSSEGENSVSKDKMSEDPENEKPKLLIRLTREEIEEDYLEMTGKKLLRNKMRRDYLVVRASAF